MILVAVLAVAGIAGIAAAFFFSMRPGRSRAGATPGRRGSTGPRGSGVPRGSRPDPAAGDRPPGRPSGTAPTSSGRPAQPGSPARSTRLAQPAGGMPDIELTGPSTVLDFTGPQSLLEDTGPAVSGHRARHGDPWDDAPQEAVPDGRIAARHSPEADPGDADLPRSRRRVAWRKGTDVDEELWPAEAFGGVSDEQFWGDLAADRPLATTARTAQPDAGVRKRPPQAGRLPDLPPADLGRQATPRGTSGGAATRPPSRPGPNDQTAVPGRTAVTECHPSGPGRRSASRRSASRLPGPVARRNRRGRGSADQPGVRAAAPRSGRRPPPPAVEPAQVRGRREHGPAPARGKPARAAPAGQVLAGLHACAAVPACRRRRARLTGQVRETATAARPTCTHSSPIPGPLPRRTPRPAARGTDTGTRPPGRPARSATPGTPTAAGIPPRRAVTARPAGVRVRYTRRRATATEVLTTRAARTAASQPARSAGILHNSNSRIKHGLCPRETWCGTPPGACTRRWRGGC